MISVKLQEFMLEECFNPYLLGGELVTPQTTLI